MTRCDAKTKTKTKITNIYSHTHIPKLYFMHVFAFKYSNYSWVCVCFFFQSILLAEIFVSPLFKVYSHTHIYSYEYRWDNSLIMQKSHMVQSEMFGMNYIETAQLLYRDWAWHFVGDLVNIQSFSIKWHGQVIGIVFVPMFHMKSVRKLSFWDWFDFMVRSFCDWL